MNTGEKLKGFPSVNYINLYDCPVRRVFMETQFREFGIRGNIYQTDRYANIKQNLNISTLPENFQMPDIQIGAMVSNINNMKQWYDNTDEPYAIFCDDDTSFDSINDWNFTWREFVENLPMGWKCIQLIRMYDTITPEIVGSISLQLKPGRWWGAAFMFTRDYVEHLLKILLREDGSYNLSSNGGQYYPCVENILALNWHMVYNFPLLTENNETLRPTVPVEPTYPCEGRVREARKICNYITRHYWKYCSSDLDIRKALEIS